MKSGKANPECKGQNGVRGSSNWRALWIVAFLATLAPLMLAGCAGVVSSASSSTTPPPTSVVISNVQAVATTTSSTQIAWTTSVPSDSSVDYGTSTTYGATTSVDPNMVTNHMATITGLSPATTYYFQVSSTDSKKNNGKSGGHTVKTNGLGISGSITPSAGGSGASVALGGAASATTTADGNGNFSFANLGNGSYTVSASHAGYTMSPGSQNVNLSGASVTSVNFSASAQTPQTFSITGTISPTAGGSGAVVALSGASSASTVANSSGVYAFTGLANGTYTVTPSNSGYTFGPGSQTAVVNGANVSAVNFVATPQTTPTFSISGTISPIAGGNGATVTLGGAVSATSTADTSGNYTFTGLANGSYTVTPSKAGYAFSPTNLAATVNGANVTGVNFTGTALTFSISGTISPTAGGSGATVTLSGAANATTTANSSGNYTFAGLANGAYTITPSIAGYTFTPASLSATVNGANVTGVNFTGTAQTFSISGTLSPTAGGSGATVTLSGAANATTIANSSGSYTFTGLANGAYTITPSNTGYSFTPASLSATVNGANVAGVNFTSAAQTFSISGTISPTTGGSGATVTLSGATSATTTANSSGAYTFTGLANGNYTITASKSGYTFTPASLAATVNGANITGLNFADTAVTFSISGTISPTAGGAGATVSLSGAASATTTANSSGAYTFTGLSNGTYAVTPTRTGYTFTPSSQAATVNGANVTGINFTDTAQTFSISGTISPTTGGSGATVTLSGASNATTLANVSGAYSFAGLLNGSYTVTPTNAGFTFTPASQNVVVSIANVSGVNFTAAAQGGTLPTVPTGLTASAASSSQINLSWNASTDSGGTLAGYKIYRGGTQVGTSTTTSYQDTGLAASTTYSYTVAAYDTLGNTSGQSGSASATTQASGGGGIPSSLGWYQIPNTAYQSVCPSAASYPSIQGQTGCSAVVDAWAGGTADTKRNWLVFTGGGHHDYWGNEVYALDLNALAIKRLDNPSSIGSLNFSVQSSETLPDGTPSARHTYGGVTYIPSGDVVYMYGGGISGIGDLSSVTWTLQDGGLSAGSTGVCCWTQKNPSGGTPDSQFGELAAYDANTDSVFLWDPWQSQSGHLWQYKLSTNAYTLLTTFGGSAFMNGYQSGAIDPTRRLFFAIGNGKLLQVSIAAGSNYSVTDLAGSATGCSAAIGAAYPGVAFDSISNNMVIWAGGNAAYVYNPTTNACTAQTYSGGPTTVGQNGTYGRFQFFPALGVFAVCNQWAENCFTLRLDAVVGGSGPVISNVSSSGVSTSGATVSWTTDVPASSQVDYGPSTAYGSSTSLNSSLVTNHSAALSGLTAGTTYHFRVRSSNSGGATSTSGDFSFATSTGVSTPPSVAVTAPSNGVTVSGSVSVAATASASVGIASVQMQVDGSALGTLLTQAPYTMGWDTTTASNGAHSLTAVASDTAGNTATSAVVAVTVANTVSSTVNGWTGRIAGVNVPGGAASIVSSQSFDIFPVTNKQQYFQIYDAGGITTDCTVAADGCSLKFTMLPGYFQGQPGWFDYNFNSSLTALYGQGQEFYVQFKERVSPSLLSGSTFTNFEGWKLNILSEGDSPSAQAGNCSNTPSDFVLVSDGTTFPWIYENCGGTGSSLNFLNSAYAPLQLYSPSTTNYLDQPATGCPHYSGRGTPSTDPTCWNFVGNEWFTVQEHIKIGTWNQPNSVVDVWVAHQGQPAVLITNAADIAMADQGPSVTDKFGKIVLLPYATNATWNTLSNVWYDDLIVSNRRIPDPEVSVPNAPDSMSLSNISSSSVTVNWRVNSNNGTAQDDTGFLVERCTGVASACLPNPQSGFSQIGATAANASSFVDTTVSAGHTYTYRVRAKNAAGNSPYAIAICFNGATTCGSTAGL